MTRAETRSLIKTAIEVLGNQIQFGSGRITDINKEQSKEYPFIWLESLSVSTRINNQGAYMDDWDTKINIAMKDKVDATAEETEAIIDQCDYIAQQITKQLADQLQDAKLVSFDNTTRTPFAHKHADDTSGVILAFTLSAPDTTNLC